MKSKDQLLLEQAYEATKLISGQYDADYSKLSDDELLKKYRECLKYTFEPGHDFDEGQKHDAERPKVFAELKKRGLGDKGADEFAYAQKMAR